MASSKTAAATFLGLGLAIWQLAAGAAEPTLAVVKLSAAQQRAAGIATASVEKAANGAQPSGPGGLQLQGRVTLPGTAIAVVQANVAGQIEQLYVNPGEQVRVGTPLASLYSAELLDLQRAYLEAAGADAVATARLRRDEALFADGIIAALRLQETRAAAQAASAALQQQRQLLLLAGMGEGAVAALRDASAMSPRLTLTARTSGVVLEQGVVAGGRVQTGDLLFRIASGDRFLIDLQATRADAARLQVGDAVSVAGCAAAGKVTSVGTQLDPQSQTVLVRATLAATAGCVRANEYVRLSVLPAGMAGALLSVPASAVVRYGARDYVFVAEAAGFRPQPVTVMQAHGERSWVQAPGLAAGARVVSAGTSALKGSLQGLGAAAGGQ